MKRFWLGRFSKKPKLESPHSFHSIESHTSTTKCYVASGLQKVAQVTNTNCVTLDLGSWEYLLWSSDVWGDECSTTQVMGSQDRKRENRFGYLCFFVTGAKRLFDLVQAADERVRIAFYYACRDCMVVQDLDTAVHLNSGQQKFRVVTLKVSTSER